MTRRRTPFIAAFWIACGAGLCAAAFVAAGAQTPSNAPALPPIADGPFEPDRTSLAAHQAPEWFRDATSGTRFRLAESGDPSKVGCKHVIHGGKAACLDSNALLAFHKGNGAEYFMALANHDGNVDNFNSRFQRWNSLALGPQEDLVGDPGLDRGPAAGSPSRHRERPSFLAPAS